MIIMVSIGCIHHMVFFSVKINIILCIKILTIVVIMSSLHYKRGVTKPIGFAFYACPYITLLFPDNNFEAIHLKIDKPDRSPKNLAWRLSLLWIVFMTMHKYLGPT